MNVNEHSRARTMLLQQRVEGLSDQDSRWLESHLFACDECSQQAEALAEKMQQTRSEVFSITASPALVRSTQLRVRARARHLQRQQERMMPAWMAAAMVLGWTVVSTPFLWQGFSYLGNQFHAPAVLWQSGFLFSWVTPTALIAAAAISRRDRQENRT